MRRKIIKHGTSTLSVSLPLKWARALKLSKGEEVEVEERGNQLIIAGKGSEIQGKKGFLDIKDPSKYARRLIHKFYKEGYDELKIKYTDPSIMARVQLALDGAPGFEIVDQGKDYVLVKNVSTGLDEEFDTLLNRMFLLNILMANEILEGIKKNKDELIKNVINHDFNVNKLSLFCLRHLYKKGYKDCSQTAPLYSDVKVLEQIGDILRYLGVYLTDTEHRKFMHAPKSKDFTKKAKVGKELIKSFEKAIKVMEYAHKHFRNFTNEQITEIRQIRTELEKRIFDQMSSNTLYEIVISHYLLSIIYQIRHLNELS